MSTRTLTLDDLIAFVRKGGADVEALKKQYADHLSKKAKAEADAEEDEDAEDEDEEDEDADSEDSEEDEDAEEAEDEEDEDADSEDSEEDDEGMEVYQTTTFDDRGEDNTYADYTYYQCWGGGPAGGYIAKNGKVFRVNQESMFAPYTIEPVNGFIGIRMKDDVMHLRVLKDISAYNK